MKFGTQYRFFGVQDFRNCYAKGSSAWWLSEKKCTGFHQVLFFCSGLYWRCFCRTWHFTLLQKHQRQPVPTCRSPKSQRWGKCHKRLSRAATLERQTPSAEAEINKAVGVLHHSERRARAGRLCHTIRIPQLPKGN